jgi:hypothetical protein
MRYSSKLVRTSGMLVGSFILLTASAIPQVGAPARTSSASAYRPANTEVIPPCVATSTSPPGAHTPAGASPAPHSVTLSWNASTPASKAKPDAVQGYHVYRSLKSQTYTESNRISSSPLQGTQCVDTTVEPRATYFYVVKAVSQSGTISGFSNETKAVIPFP